MKNVFGNIDMSWKKLILFSIITGVYTGLVMCIPFFSNTSFQDIGISYECWVLFAVVVVVNCKNWKEAMVKCFIFFLISQPLVYIVEIIFKHISFDMGYYYYSRIWFPATLLTIPGGLIAYFCKKQNIIGSIILGLGNTILSVMGVYYFLVLINNFPYHLLTTIFCFGTIVILTLGIQKKLLNRVICFSIPIILTILFIIYVKLMGLSII